MNWLPYIHDPGEQMEERGMERGICYLKTWPKVEYITFTHMLLFRLGYMAK